MGQFWDDITRAYDQHLQVPGKETHFLILLAFVLSFGDAFTLLGVILLASIPLVWLVGGKRGVESSGNFVLE